MSDVVATVRAIVARHTSRAGFDDTTPLGGDGVGLDSIAIAEVLLACEERFGVELGDLLGGEPVTVLRIAERLSCG